MEINEITLTDVFNMITMHIQISRDQRHVFIAHFTYTPSEKFLIISGNDLFGYIEIVGNRMKLTSTTENLEMEQLKSRLSNWFDKQEKLKVDEQKYLNEIKKKQEVADQERLKNDMFSGQQGGQVYREITFTSPLDIIIDENTFKK